jgi:hypothetical protein
MKKSFIIVGMLSLLLAACMGGTPTPAPIATIVEPATIVAPSATLPAPTATQTLAPVATETPAAAPTATVAPTSGPTPTLGPDGWKSVPVIPTAISKRVMLIYQMGLLKGNNPQAYSKVGDCNVTMPYFMGDFDTPEKVTLGDFSGLQDSIDFFKGSHARKSMAAKQGLTAHAVLSMLWVDWKQCESYETPLTCEYRLNRPMYAIIAFGTNDASGNVDFDKAMRRVLDMTIGNGTIPILATKADNAEGDNSFNRTIVDLAYEYELPVWNYWAAVQALPNHGLKDAEHLQHLSEGNLGLFNFTSENMQYGWPVRNLTALQVLDAMRRLTADVQK